MSPMWVMPLAGTFTRTPLSDTTDQAVRTMLQSVKKALDGSDALVSMWSGHGYPAPPLCDGVRVLSWNSDADASSGLSPGDFVGPCALSGAEHPPRDGTDATGRRHPGSARWKPCASSKAA